MGMDRVAPAPRSSEPSHGQNTTANPAQSDRRPVLRIRCDVLVRCVLHRIVDLFFRDAPLGVIGEEVLSVCLVPAHPPSCCHASVSIYRRYIQVKRNRSPLGVGYRLEWSSAPAAAELDHGCEGTGPPASVVSPDPFWRRRDRAPSRTEDAGYFNLLQIHSKNLKCVGLTGARARFVFEIAPAQANFLVRRRSAVRSRPWAPLGLSHKGFPSPLSKQHRCTARSGSGSHYC
jgi:hypothetical protein